MTWILTQSATQADILKPQAKQIRIDDICHGLAHVCRFNGQTRHHYSVAQHCLIVADIVPQEHKLAGLLHDATEAYLADIARPIKLLMIEAAKRRNNAWMEVLNLHALKPTDAWGYACSLRIFNDAEFNGLSILIDTYKQLEARMWVTICERFDLDPELPDCVHEADMIALATERQQLMPPHPEPWACLEGVQPLPGSIPEWTPFYARQAFHHRLMELLATTHRAKVHAQAERELIHGTSSASPAGLMSIAQEVKA
ncbi:phosphohydrolase [Ectopseudomonas mendocina]|uniref:phosphohydrolase n=1 Tax=Ectopseudomonas mendocina TaxID=300 RepID=UPI003F09C170